MLNKMPVITHRPFIKLIVSFVSAGHISSNLSQNNDSRCSFIHDWQYLWLNNVSWVESIESKCDSDMVTTKTTTMNHVISIFAERIIFHVCDDDDDSKNSLIAYLVSISHFECNPLCIYESPSNPQTTLAHTWHMLEWKAYCVDTKLICF